MFAVEWIVFTFAKLSSSHKNFHNFVQLNPEIYDWNPSNLKWQYAMSELISFMRNQFHLKYEGDWAT